MRKTTAERLLSINREFYQSFAGPFSATRRRLQPGVERILETADLSVNMLDLGCAHGVLAEELLERGFLGRYVGLDVSRALLDAISDSLQPPQFKFGSADLGYREWPEIARALLSEGEAANQNEIENNAGFDWVFALAVLHHLPTQEILRSTVRGIQELLNPGGSVAVSVWDFLASPRFQDRILPWETAGLSADDVDAGDYLLDWREGGRGVRYVHHFSSEELRGLAEGSGLQVKVEFQSDGENGRLGLYQVWSS